MKKSISREEWSTLILFLAILFGTFIRFNPTILSEFAITNALFYQAEDFDAAAELADCIAQLVLSARRDRIDILIEKQRLGPLTAVQKDELRQLTRGAGTGG